MVVQFPLKRCRKSINLRIFPRQSAHCTFHRCLLHSELVLTAGFVRSGDTARKTLLWRDQSGDREMTGARADQTAQKSGPMNDPGGSARTRPSSEWRCGRMPSAEAGTTIAKRGRVERAIGRRQRSRAGNLDPDARRQHGGKQQASQPRFMLKEASADQMFNARAGD